METIDSHIQKEHINSGDIATFVEIYKQYVPELLKYASKFVGVSHAEDFVQDVFIYLWAHRKRLQINGSLRGYLYESIQNRCLNYLDQLKLKASYEAKVILEQQTSDISADSTESQLIRDETSERLQREIENLPEKRRQIVKMLYYDYKKPKTIA